MKIDSKSVLAILFCFLILPACSSLRPPTTDALLTDDYTLVKDYMRKFIAKEMKKAKITGLSVALVDADRIVWSEGFGFSDKSSKTPSSAETQYRAGSVSKLFTAIAAMQLEEKGLLDLNEPLRTYVPEFNIKSRFGSIDEITLRNTLSHHAGIPNLYLDGMWTNEPESFKKVATYLNDYYTAFAPNTLFSYSNAGYSLVGHAIESVSGKSFAQYQQEQILNKLEMSHSNFEMNTSDPLVSKSYHNGKPVDELGLRDLPAGGLVTNVADLSKLVIEMHAIEKGETKLLQPSTLKRMMKTQFYDSDLELTRYNGLGFLHHPSLLESSVDIIGHGGQTMAHSALLISAPEWELGVVILANTPNLTGALEKISAEILKMSYPVKLHKPLDLQKPETTISLPGTQTSFEGRYASDLGLVNIEGGPTQYKVKAMNQKFSLAANDSGEHKLTLKLFGFIPISPKELNRPNFHARELDGKKLIIVENRSDRQVIATEVLPQGINNAWHDRIGDYSIVNPIDTEFDLFKVKEVSLGYEDQTYYLDVETPKGIFRNPLTIVNDVEATIQGMGRGRGETILAQPDDSILHSGLRLSRNK